MSAAFGERGEKGLRESDVFCAFDPKITEVGFTGYIKQVLNICSRHFQCTYVLSPFNLRIF